DRRRRVRHLPEHVGRRRPTRRAHVLQAGEPPRADADAVGEGGCAMSGVSWGIVGRPPSTLALSLSKGERSGQAFRARRGPERPALLLFLLLVATTAFAQGRQWPTERPPSALAARDIKFPPYELQTLPNGLQVVAVLHHEQPVVNMRLLIRAGAAADPKNKLGLAHMAA